MSLIKRGRCILQNSSIFDMGMLLLRLNMTTSTLGHWDTSLFMSMSVPILNNVKSSILKRIAWERVVVCCCQRERERVGIVWNLPASPYSPSFCPSQWHQHEYSRTAFCEKALNSFSLSWFRARLYETDPNHSSETVSSWVSWSETKHLHPDSSPWRTLSETKVKVAYYYFRPSRPRKDPLVRFHRRHYRIFSYFFSWIQKKKCWRVLSQDLITIKTLLWLTLFSFFLLSRIEIVVFFSFET